MTDFRYTPRAVGAIKLHAKTMAPATIATIMRSSVGTVELICRKHGIEMRENDFVVPQMPTRAERKRTGSHIEILIDDVAFSLIAHEAKRRGTATRDLISRVAEEVARAQLFSAVLDR